MSLWVLGFHGQCFVHSCINYTFLYILLIAHIIVTKAA